MRGRVHRTMRCVLALLKGSNCDGLCNNLVISKLYSSGRFARGMYAVRFLNSTSSIDPLSILGAKIRIKSTM